VIKIILGTLVSTILLVSVIVVFYWRDIKYDPNGQDFLIFFGVIPAAITLLILSPMLIKKIYQSHQEKKEQQRIEAEQRSEQQQTTEAKVEEKIEWVDLKVYSATSLSALGENEAQLDQLQDVASPELDSQLVNGYGLPILSFRVQEIEEPLEDEASSLSTRQKRISALIQQQLEQNTETLYQIAEHLKNSALFMMPNLHMNIVCILLGLTLIVTMRMSR
jgi:flagellar biosynthesis component FlhA